MAQANLYIDLCGRPYSLADLDDEERQLIRECESFAGENSDWGVYHNFWLPRVDLLYSQRGLSRREILQTSVYRIAQDIGGRLQVASGEARAPDYRDELSELIRNQYATKRDFCATTGLSEDMLSHVLAKRKHLSIDTLTDALAKIGYTIHIQPLPNVKT